MYRLTAIRLVNWLHFTDVTRPIAGTTLLTGENGEGKSTVLDAIQLALVADLRQLNFNHAVGHTPGRQRRTLKGYVLWAEKRDDDNAPIRYKRASATAFVLLQFEDVPATGAFGPKSGVTALRPPFVCGVVVEAAAKGGDPTRLHVILPGAKLADVPAIDPATRLATPLRDIEALVKQRRGATATSASESYLDALRFQMGRLPKSLFPSLLTKGLAFKPMASVHDFVVEFLLEPRPIETGRLVENLVHYEEMQRESERATARLGALDELVHLGDDVLAKERARDIAQFVSLRAEVEVAGDEEAHQASVAADNDATRAEAAEEGQRQGERKEAAEREVARLNRALATDDRVREKKGLDDEAAGLEARLSQADEAERQVREELATQRALMESVLAPSVPAGLLTDGDFRDALGNDVVIGADPQLPVIRAHIARLNPEGTLDGRALESWGEELGRLAGALSVLRFSLTRRHNALRKEGTELREQRDQIAAGKVRYDPKLEAFRYGLQLAVKRGEITLRRPVVPFCELIDDVEPEWQHAVEAWMGGRRYDLIPDPQDFAVVNGWYERHRDACPAPDGSHVRLFGVSVVNMERVLKRSSGGVAQDPLSDAVRTTNPLAQSYLDFLLARVQRCRSVSEFGRYDLAATADGFLYRGFRTERVQAPGSFVLGLAARAAEQRRLEQEIGVIAHALARLGPIDQWLRTVEAASLRAQQRWPLVPDRLATLDARVDLEHRLARVRQQRDAIDLSHVAGLERELEVATKNHKSAEDAWLAARDAEQKAAWEAENARKQGAQATSFLRQRTAQLAEAFPMPETDPRWDEHRARFEERLREIAGGPKELAANYQRRHTAAIKLAKDAWTLFAGKRVAYEQTYEPIVADEPAPVALLRAEAERWRSTKLPEYARQIGERIAAARVQLLDDVLAQLHSHFAELKKTLTTLNRALQTCVFGKDQYEFTWKPSEALRQYHDLIMELAPAFDLAGSGSAYELLESNPVMQARLDELLAALTGSRSNPLAGLERVRDYREYFDYDIRVLDGQGQLYQLNRNAGVASGGEVQTPTYVALFASLQQMYGATATTAAQCGLFLVDESFALLDDRRIPALMSWVQQLGLQGILAMPTGREAHFAPYAESILLVSRDTAGLGRLDDAHDLTRLLAASDEAA